MLQTVNNKKMLTSTSYDRSKKLVRIWLPAAATLYLTLGDIWGLPYVTQVAATISAVALFLGLVLNVSQKNYDNSGVGVDGEIQVGMNPDTGHTIYNFIPKGDHSTWQNQDNVTLNVVPAPPTAPPTIPMDLDQPLQPPVPPVPPKKP